MEAASVRTGFRREGHRHREENGEQIGCFVTPEQFAGPNPPVPGRTCPTAPNKDQVSIESKCGCGSGRAGAIGGARPLSPIPSRQRRIDAGSVSAAITRIGPPQSGQPLTSVRSV